MAQREGCDDDDVLGDNDDDVLGISHVISGAPFLNKTDPLHNLRPSKVKKTKERFSNQ